MTRTFYLTGPFLDNPISTPIVEFLINFFLQQWLIENFPEKFSPSGTSLLLPAVQVPDHDLYLSQGPTFSLLAYIITLFDPFEAWHL